MLCDVLCDMDTCLLTSCDRLILCDVEAEIDADVDALTDAEMLVALDTDSL